MKQGWEVKKLGDVCELYQPKTISSKEMVDDGKYPVFGANGIIGKYDKYNHEEPQLLITCRGATCGSINISEPKSWINGNAMVVRPKDNSLSLKFIEYLFLGGIDISKTITGAAQPQITRQTLSPVLISYPSSIQEQQRIVAILDEAFAAIAKVKSYAEQNLKNAKELFESYLHGVFENKSDGWINTTIGETCNLQTGGTPSTSKKEFYEGGTIKWLVSGDINLKVVNDCEGRITELGMNSSNTKYLPVNSVLIALNGQGKTRGTVAMLRTKATCNQSLVSIFPKDEKILLPELVFSNLEGRYDEIRKMTGDGGNDRRGLNMPLIRSIKFSYPKNITEQKEIIKKLENLRAETKKLEAIYQQKNIDLEELKKSVLQKAFSGELKI